MSHQNHEHQSLRLVKVEGSKPEDSNWYECKAGCLVLMRELCQLPQRAEEAEAAKAGIRIERSFVALDESTHDTIQQARARNRVILEVEELEKFLVPRTRALEDGDGFIQQELEKVDELRVQMLKLAAKEFNKTIDQKTRLEALLEEAYDMESSLTEPTHPLYKLYGRLKCIDRDGREWQTPMLAEDPQAGKQFCLNEVSQ